MQYKKTDSNRRYTAPWVRISILLGSVFAAASISKIFTGELIPTSATDALVMQNALLLVVLGSAVLEHFFTKPADASVNALMGLVTLIPAQPFSPQIPWIIITGYCFVTFVLAISCVAASSSEPIEGIRKRVADVTYRPAVVLGQARILFSIVFLFAVFSFYEMGSPHAASLVVFWGIFVAIWPLRLPQLLTQLFESRYVRESPVGRLLRADSPRILRFALERPTYWERKLPLVFIRRAGEAEWILPIYSHFHHEQEIGTALELGQIAQSEAGQLPGCVYATEDMEILPKDQWFQKFDQSPDVDLAGFVVENSEISHIRFEAREPRQCHDGMLVRCGIGDQQVYYQVTNGITTEEPFDAGRHGYQVARASQLGVPHAELGFAQYDWLPQMNEPVFTSESESAGEPWPCPESDFMYGTIPHSAFPISGEFARNFNHHTALLGVTGSGKTELAFDLIRHAVQAKIKVICVDLTDQYAGRLSDLYPKDLSVTAETADDLNDKLFDAETGPYGAGAEKRALKEFGDRLRVDVSASVEEFIEAENENNQLGIIKLQEISNTKATLWITELYMSCVLNYAREHLDENRKVLIVVEEAHTVMPEPATMGVGDFDSKGIVGKISQVALQGRKYGVGLLVIAQRTANVSKTVLTQCNTMISFAGYDDTSLNFLRNVFGAEHVSMIPRLGVRQAIVFGKAVRSERPVVVQIPYDYAKEQGNS